MHFPESGDIISMIETAENIKQHNFYRRKFVMGRKVLIFGATGEIGSRIANLAVKAGHTVIGACRGMQHSCQGYVDLSGVEFVRGNKYDHDYLDKLASYKPEVIIDTLGNESMIPLIEKHFPNVENVMFCSSTGSFVPLQYFPANEEHPWREDTGLNFFHQSQWDIKALNECAAGRFPITILRPTNIIGETVCPLELWGGRNIEFYKKLKNNEPLFIPPCLDIMVQSGYNWDLASAFALAIDHPDEVRGEIFIISSKKAVTLKTFLDTAMKHLNSSSEVIVVPNEDLIRIYPEIRIHFGLDFLELHMCFDIGKAQRILGYDPKVSTTEGLVRALTWLEENGKL